MRNAKISSLFGQTGEEFAASWYHRSGYRILDRNWRCRAGELDIVCEREGGVVFVEVKTRHSPGFGGGLAAVGPKKQGRIIAAALMWLNVNARWQAPCRFDVVCLYGRPGNFRMELYQDAFSQSLDCSNSYRQY